MLTYDHFIVSGQCPLGWLGCENSGLGSPFFNRDGPIAVLLSPHIVPPLSLSISVSSLQLFYHVLVRGGRILMASVYLSSHSFPAHPLSYHTEREQNTELGSDFLSLIFWTNSITKTSKLTHITDFFSEFSCRSCTNAYMAR